MRIACCISTTTNTHKDYVVLTAFPLKHWLHERASVLRYTFIACLVVHKNAAPYLVETRLFSLVRPIGEYCKESKGSVLLSYRTRKYTACRNVGLLVFSLAVHSVFYKR